MNRLLPSRQVAKPWGRVSLPAPFSQPADGQRVGEIWFEPPAEMPELLVKYIFTDERLSVQVHPGDVDVQSAGAGPRGKEECWLVISAELGAVLGIGFDEAIDAGQLKAAALSGEIVDMLTWHPVQSGDFFYIPAGTVHAIGGGISLIEVQQNSDLTYRLYDYGRPRELHLEQGVAVAKGTPYDAAWRKRAAIGEAVRMVEGPHFRLDQLAGPPNAATFARYGDRPVLVVTRSGSVAVGGVPVAPGACGLFASLAELVLGPDACCLVAQSCAATGRPG